MGYGKGGRRQQRKRAGRGDQGKGGKQGVKGKFDKGKDGNKNKKNDGDKDRNKARQASRVPAEAPKGEYPLGLGSDLIESLLPGGH